MGLLLLFLMCDNRFYGILKDRFFMIIYCCHRKTNNRCCHYSVYTVDAAATGSEKNGS
jgi:hypothetical protein